MHRHRLDIRLLDSDSGHWASCIGNRYRRRETGGIDIALIINRFISLRLQYAYADVHCPTPTRKSYSSVTQTMLIKRKIGKKLNIKFTLVEFELKF